MNSRALAFSILAVTTYSLSQDLWALNDMNINDERFPPKVAIEPLHSGIDARVALAAEMQSSLEIKNLKNDTEALSYLRSSEGERFMNLTKAARTGDQPSLKNIGIFVAVAVFQQMILRETQIAQVSGEVTSKSVRDRLQALVYLANVFAMVDGESEARIFVRNFNSMATMVNAPVRLMARSTSQNIIFDLFMGRDRLARYDELVEKQQQKMAAYLKSERNLRWSYLSRQP